MHVSKHAYFWFCFHYTFQKLHHSVYVLQLVFSFKIVSGKKKNLFLRSRFSAVRKFIPFPGCVTFYGVSIPVYLPIPCGCALGGVSNIFVVRNSAGVNILENVP